jgi:hypothetical protein
LILAKLKEGQCEGDKKLARYDGSCVGVILSAGKQVGQGSRQADKTAKTEWVMSQPVGMPPMPPTSAKTGTVAAFSVLGPAVAMSRDRWVEPAIQRQMWCTCSQSPVFVSRIRHVWAAKEQVPARGNVMVQLLRLPVSVVKASVPEKEFLQVLQAQPEYENRTASAQTAKIAKTNRLLRRLRAASQVSTLIARAESTLAAQQHCLRLLQSARAQSEAQTKLIS